MIPDAMLEQYVLLKESQKTIERQLNVIKDFLIQSGSFSTDYYVVAIQDQERTGIKPLHEVIKVFGIELVQEYGLIQTSSFKKVVVSKK